MPLYLEHNFSTALRGQGAELSTFLLCKTVLDLLALLPFQLWLPATSNLHTELHSYFLSRRWFRGGTTRSRCEADGVLRLSRARPFRFAMPFLLLPVNSGQTNRGCSCYFAWPMVLGRCLGAKGRG